MTRFAGSLLLLCLLGGGLLRAQDTAPPVLTAFTFTPTAVNVSTGYASVTVTAQMTDNLSGVAYADVIFESPSTGQTAECGFRLISGSNLNGAYQCGVNIPAYSEPGVWSVESVYVQDNDANGKVYYASNLQSLGFPTALQVTSNPDTAPPVLTAFTFTPTAVNVTTGFAAVTVTAQITDNLSGVAYADVIFESPSASQTAECNFLLITGSNLNGTYQCGATIPAYSAPGVWSVESVYVQDNDGNGKVYYTSDLQSLGFPAALQVTSNPDTAPPVLTAFTFTPTAVNVTTGYASVTVTAQITDNLSGVAYADMIFESPSAGQTAACNFLLITGSNLNGTYQCGATIPAYSEAGVWSVESVYVQDNEGNGKVYYTSDLQSLGFPAALQVIEGTAVVLTSSANPSSFLQAVTFTASVVSGIATPTGSVNFEDSGTTIGTGTLNASGVATFATRALNVGTHPVTANYLGDANNPPTNSTALSQVVNKDATNLTLTSSNNPSVEGQPVTFTATLIPSYGLAGGQQIGFFDGSTQIGTGTLVYGVASFATSSLGPGTHYIRAHYAGVGDADRDPVTSSPLAEQVTETADLVTTLRSERDLGMFADLAPISRTVRPLTVYALSDRAFARLSPADRGTLMDHLPAMRALLSRYITRGDDNRFDVRGAKQIPCADGMIYVLDRFDPKMVREAVHATRPLELNSNPGTH